MLIAWLYFFDEQKQSQVHCHDVLPHVMYERVWLNLGADGMQGFEKIEETSQYVVLVRR